MTATGDAILPWTDPAWLDGFRTWTEQVLAAAGTPVTAPPEQSWVVAWSTVLRVETVTGVVWAKAAVPALGFEPALYPVLAAAAPGLVPEVVATDPAGHRLVIRDAGTPLRELPGAPADPARWERLLPAYARMQLAVAPLAGELVALGVPDRRLRVLPDRFAALLDDPGALLLGRPDGLTPEEHAALRALAPQLAAACDRLAAYGVPETVDHDDLHDANVYADRSGHTRVLDWGDAGVTHPFVSLTVFTRSLAARAAVAKHGPELATLWRHYLEPFLDLVPDRDRLWEAARLADGIGHLVRALAWHELVRELAPPGRDGYAPAVPRWLRQLLAESATLSG